MTPVVDSCGPTGAASLMIELDGDGSFPVAVPVPPVRLSRRPGVLVDTWPEPEFVLARQDPPDCVATWLAKDNPARVLVACPSLVSPAQTRLALAVGRVLADQREARGAGPRPVVTCGVRPRCGWEGSGVIVPHPVTVFTRGSAQYRVVWEVSNERRLPDWHASLAPRPSMTGL
ncbi:hypothetical protein [Pseudofrankia sp. BMG5.37]|uniref:hypothetical protein n=1 Tax=Pseudofrankia sp. BMG5.37 TaxID=3050035 RepID=UPI002895E252|nr:hypothetical protein [Pseudofrankia sp. BMG5.37]MDT3438269.1 hypothetical protein [Pseudofrankia sp. BMG5.37]